MTKRKATTPTVVVDTREKKPYKFAESITKKLDAGDYSIEGQEDCFAIERKTLQDFINTIIHNRKRFAAELKKLRTYKFAAVIIECNFADIAEGNYESRVHPNALVSIVTALITSYHPVQWIFASNRQHAYRVVCNLIENAGRLER